MKSIFVIREGEEIIAARNTMDHAIAACMNRISICGLLCNGFVYGEDETIIEFGHMRTMVIERVLFRERI